MPADHRARAARPRPDRARAREAAALPRRAHHDGPRRRRQGHADARRGPARAGLRGLDELADAGGRRRLALTTDSFVVKPIRFPGGSIGELAVNGTVNDLAVAGARPLALTLSLVLEEGLARRRPARRGRGDRRGRRGGRGATSSPATRRSSSAAAATRCTSARPGSGRIDPRAQLSPALRCARATGSSSPGPIGEHGTAIMLARGEFELAAAIESDTRSLWPAVDALLDAAGPSLRCIRDATRGGVASVLNELARASGVAVVVREARRAGAARRRRAPARSSGIDPMYVANEGKLVAFVAPEARGRGARRPARRARLRGRGGDRRGQDRPAGDGARRDRVRRPPRDGHARRRSPAADLLKEEWRDGDGRVRPQPAATEAVTAHVIWMTAGLSLRRRLGRDDLGHQPVPRGHHPRDHPRHAAGGRPHPGARVRERRRSSSRPGSRPRRASSTRSC